MAWQVAFGLLVQLQLEPDRNHALLSTLLDFYEHVGLPRTLQDLGVPHTQVGWSLSLSLSLSLCAGGG